MPTDPAAPPDPGQAPEQPRADVQLSYEQARDELAEVVRSLEAGGATLDASLALWERGEHLAAICQRWLDGARARFDQARSSAPEQPA